MSNKSESVCIIIENNKGEFLLMLRDNKAEIQYPNQWVILGGQMEPDEKPEAAIRREILEEIEVKIGEPKLIKTYNWPEKIEYCFYAKIDVDPLKTPLHEGQKVEFFPKNKIIKTDLAFHDNEIMRDFFAQ